MESKDKTSIDVNDDEQWSLLRTILDTINDYLYAL